MGAFQESASQGTRLVPERMSHEQSNGMEPLPLARAGSASRALSQRGTASSAPQSQDGQLVNPTGRRGHTRLQTWGRASALLPSTFLLYQARAQDSHVGRPQPLPHPGPMESSHASARHPTCFLA